MLSFIMPLLGIAKSKNGMIVIGIIAIAASAYLYHVSMRNTILRLESNNTQLKANQRVMEDAVESTKNALTRSQEQYDVLFKEFGELQEANQRGAGIFRAIGQYVDQT
jgi:hypothetical protein